PSPYLQLRHRPVWRRGQGAQQSRPALDRAGCSACPVLLPAGGQRQGLPALPHPRKPSPVMTPGGWIILIVSVGTVTSLFAWCIYKVLSLPGETEKIHGFEAEPPDVALQKAEDARRQAQLKK